jgi:hypothetical protein
MFFWQTFCLLWWEILKTLKNSRHFAEFVRGKTLNMEQVLASFDVSLFTKIPVELAIKVATKRLRQDVTLLERASLPVEDIIDVLSFCLNTIYFVFEGSNYQQVFGTVGSPVSAVIANLVIEDAGVENIADNGTIGPRKYFCWQKEKREGRKRGKERKEGKVKKKKRREEKE